MVVSIEELYSYTTKCLPDKCQNFLIPEIPSFYIKVRPTRYIYISEFVEKDKETFFEYYGVNIMVSVIKPNKTQRAKN